MQTVVKMVKEIHLPQNEVESGLAWHEKEMETHIVKHNAGRSCIKRFGIALMRKKKIDVDHVSETKLARCLTTLDLTALGVGSTLGAGIYVVAGEVAQKTAGPAVIVSFFIAALASVLAGLCYAEFGACVPKTGSAYVYSYVSVGEIMAFIIGWNLILEYVIGTASVARAFSANFDEMIGNKISNFFLTHMHMKSDHLAAYPDFFAFLITLVLTVILSVGVKESATFTKLFTFVNLVVLTYVVICGCFKLYFPNWFIDPKDALSGNYSVPTFVKDKTNRTLPKSDQVGAGGFAPFGFNGIVSGAGTCFYAFVGFDAIATTGEEVKNPQRAIPLSITVTLLICTLAYCALSAIVTLMCPYYLLDPSSPLPNIFSLVGWNVARYIIAIGAICALSTSLLGAMFPLPRVIYAMASDGLLFRFLSRVHQRSKTPLISTILSGLFAGTMACIFDLKSLVDMMSIGTLLAYTLVAVSVLILRGNEHSLSRTSESHNESEKNERAKNLDSVNNAVAQIENEKEQSKNRLTFRLYARHSFVKYSDKATRLTEFINKTNTFLFFVFITIFAFILSKEELLHLPYVLFFLVFTSLISIVLMITIKIQPENKAKISFRVPGVPWVPCISIFVNVYLMMKLPGETWYRFAIWMLVGFVIYFSYGIRESSERSVVKHRLLRNEKAYAHARDELLPRWMKLSRSTIISLVDSRTRSCF